MANTINGTINVKIQVQGGAITASTAGGGLSGGGTGGGIGGVPKGWFSPTGVSPSMLNFERMMQQQQKNLVNFRQKEQKEEAKNENLYDKQISEGFKQYDKYMIEDLKIGKQIEKQGLLKMKDEAIYAKSIQEQGGIFKKFLPSLGVIGGALGIAGILQQSKIISESTKTVNDLLGALVDVILIPLIPILVPALKALAMFVGQYAAYLQDPIGQIEKMFSKLVDNIEKKFSFLTPIFDMLGKIIETISKILSPILKTLGIKDTLKEHASDFLKQLPSMGGPFSFIKESFDVWKDIINKNTITNQQAPIPGNFSGATRSFDNNTIIVNMNGADISNISNPTSYGQSVGRGLLEEMDRRIP